MHAPLGGASAFGLARLNADGSVDATLGSGGVLTTTFPGDAAVTALVIQSDGNIVAIGSTVDTTTGATALVLARYMG